MLVFKISKWEYYRMSSTEMAVIFSMWLNMIIKMQKENEV